MEQQGGEVCFWGGSASGDIDPYYQTLRERGVTIVEESANQHWADRSFTVQDCNGFTRTKTNREILTRML